MSKSLKILVGIFTYLTTLAVLIFAGGFFWLSYEFSKPGPLAAETLFTAERGQGVSAIAANLKNAGIIEQPLIFKASARILGVHTELKAGEYLVPARASMKDVMFKMSEGDIFARRYTVREGLTSYEIVNILKNVEELEGETPPIPKEGTLLPETYSYNLGDTRQGEIEKMQAAMTKTIEELWPKRAPNLPFETKEQAITLASIVEKETGVPDERKRVAGVFINRLRRGIPLQTDPTVIYALTKGKHKNEGKGPLGRRLLSKDLETDSPYNTYKYAGLPPGPIANPGRASIEAVLNPEEHDFIYFVADGTGGHVFAATLDEHNKNVTQWRKIRREQEKN